MDSIPPFRLPTREEQSICQFVPTREEQASVSSTQKKWKDSGVSRCVEGTVVSVVVTNVLCSSGESWKPAWPLEAAATACSGWGSCAILWEGGRGERRWIVGQSP